MSAISWIKIETSSFDNNKIRLINKMPQGDMILYTWFRLLIEAGKSNDNGYIYVDKDMPYTCEMLARVFDRTVKKVRMALDTLRKFKLIDIDDNDFIRIINWDKHQNVEKMNLIKEAEDEKLNRIRMQGRERAARYRERKRINKENSLKNELDQYNQECNKSLDKYTVKAEDSSLAKDDYSSKVKAEDDNSVKDEYSSQIKADDVSLVKVDYSSQVKTEDDCQKEVEYGEEVLATDKVVLEKQDFSIDEAEGKKSDSELMKNESNVIVTGSNVTVTDKNKIRNRIRDREETDTNRDKYNSVSASNVNENNQVTESNALSLKGDCEGINNKSYEDAANCDHKSSMSNKQVDYSLQNSSSDYADKSSDVSKFIKSYEKGDYCKLTEKEEEAVAILRNYENVSGKCGWIDFSVVKLMLKNHQKEYVKMAFDRAIKAKKFKMNYILGILRNWKNYGYPKEGEDFINGRGNKLSFGADKEKFAGIKKECRAELTSDEWNELERELI